MKNLTIAFLAAVSLMSFAGCKKKGGGDMVGKYTELKDRMCKCTDKTCADGVVADMAKLADASAKGEAKAPDPEEAKKYAPIMKEYGDCMAKAMGAGNMAAPPPGDKPAAAPAGDKPADPAAAAPPAGDKPAGDKPAGDKPAGAN